MTSEPIQGRSRRKSAKAGDGLRLAFGVDPSRRRFYSLRQSRYDAVADDISEWAADAAGRGTRLAVLDVGCAWGVLLRHLQAKPHFENVDLSATDIVDTVVDRERYRAFFLGDLTGGYPEIPSASYDVVVCEQVLEHLHDLDAALATLQRLVKPGGRLIIGVPIFLPPLHLIRKHVLPALFRLVPLRDLGTHHQAFSLASFLRELRRFPDMQVKKARGFRVISGGLLGPLEQYRWWWHLNRRIGQAIPAACIEAQIILEKTA
jgi:SAM-dependent methyltransferase